jgi:hypothetical protein
MSEHDRQQWEVRAEYLRSELAVMPVNRFNLVKVNDRELELRRIEARLRRESELHAAFLAHRAELVSRHHAFAARNGGR